VKFRKRGACRKASRNRLALAAAATLLLAGALPAQNGRQIIPLGSKLYSMMDSLYLEQGMARPSQARPWTAVEAAAALELIDSSTLSGAGLRAYAAIQAELDARPDWAEEDFQFASDPRITLETYARLNMGKDAAASEEAYLWNHGYSERAPFVSLPLGFWFGESFHLFSDLAFKEEATAVDSAWRADGSFAPGVLDNYLNVILDDANPRLDIHFPFRAYMSAGGRGWNLQFGRDRLSWGNGFTGNMLLSDAPDFYDFASLAFTAGSFKMSNVYASLDPFLPNSAHTRLKSISLVAHRLEFRFGDRFSMAVNESLIMGDETLEADPLRDSNFMMVFHNWLLTERANSLMSLEFEANPWKYLGLYGQAAMDEFATKYEIERGGGGGPPIFGYLLGAKGAFPAGPGYLSACLEWAMTSPWLYNRRTYPYFVDVRRFWSISTDRYEYLARPLGYRYGPDAIVVCGQAGYDVPGGPSASLDMRLIIKGEKEVGSAWNPAPGDMAPTGVAETSFIVHAKGAYPVLPWLNATADIYLDICRNRDHLVGAFRDDLEFALGLSAVWE